VVIPAYNEEKTVGAVVRAAVRAECVDEVIVVSDGSSDRTADEARSHGARVIEFEKNRGKAAAMKAGMLAARNDVLLFLDADLLGLNPDHICRMVQPVVSGEAHMSVGVMRRGRPATDFAQVVTPFLSGMRAGRLEAFEPLRTLEEAGWGVEVALTLWAREHKMKVKEVTMVGVTQRMKEEKQGLVRGFMARLRMYWDIVRMVPKSERVRR
jgi:CTP:molybdopterin cytidylyltransferase MocA